MLALFRIALVFLAGGYQFVLETPKVNRLGDV
jgi:hypothetical protein